MEVETEGGRGESERENDKKRCACGSLPTRVKPYKKVDNFAHVNASIRMQGVSISENANYLFGYKRTRPGPFKPRLLHDTETACDNISYISDTRLYK